MTSRPTPADLEALLKLAEAATPRPWEATRWAAKDIDGNNLYRNTIVDAAPGLVADTQESHCDEADVRSQLAVAKELHAGAVAMYKQVAAERDALKANRWSCGWSKYSDWCWIRRDHLGVDICEIRQSERDGRWRWRRTEPASYATADEAKAAADAALLAAGWWLEGA